MILSTASPTLAPGGAWLLAGVAFALYLLAALPVARLARLSSAALVGAFVLHLLLLVIDIGGFGQAEAGTRLGFGPVLSMTVWLVITVHTVESRLVPLPAVRQWLGLAGAVAVLLAALFPGELRPLASALAPLHFALGVGSYGLFGAAVVHAVMLDAAERRLRSGANAGRAPAPGRAMGMPLLQLERLTFRFVEAGFAVLTATLLLGAVTAAHWRWDHKTVFSLLAWGVFAALLAGHRLRGWRGRRATRWLYAGAALLLLAYAGSRFVVEVLLPRGAG
ncbi:MAG: cytochrome c biogenesis protein CcsA [Rubrivivax sp.]|nr:cytochrome c biogenesis protein CcsA [Rubrivivax sp.]